MDFPANSSRRGMSRPLRIAIAPWFQWLPGGYWNLVGLFPEHCSSPQDNKYAFLVHSEAENIGATIVMFGCGATLRSCLLHNSIQN
jgi:hypothetical protein